MQPQTDKTAAPETLNVPVRDIRPSTSNPRKTFREEGLAELADSIKKFGVLQPILLRPYVVNGPITEPNQYEIIAGERRWRASKLAGVETIPARVVEVNDVDMLELQIIENLQREDLHPLEEAESYEALLSAHGAGNDHPLTVDDIAAKLGKSRAYIYARMKLCALQPGCRDAFYAGKLTPSTALLLARIPVPDLQIKALEEITEAWNGVMSYRAAQQHIQNNYMLRLDQARFKIADESLVPAAGACTSCHKRTGANPDLFDDVGHADVCTDPVCFAEKKAAHAERIRTAAKESGQKVITGKAAEKIRPSLYSSQLKGYVRADDSPWWIDSNKTVKRLLGSTGLDVTLLECPHTGEMIEILPEAEVKEALKKKGVKLSRAGSEQNASAREQDKKVKAERTFRRAVLTDIHTRARERLKQGETLFEDDLRRIAAHALQRMGSDSTPHVAALWGWPPKDFAAHTKAMEAMTLDELALLLLDIALVDYTYISNWTTNFSIMPAPLAAAAARYGVDRKAIKRQLQVSPPKARKTLPSVPAESDGIEPTPSATVEPTPNDDAGRLEQPTPITFGIDHAEGPDTTETWSAKASWPFNGNSLAVPIQIHTTLRDDLLAESRPPIEGDSSTKAADPAKAASKPNAPKVKYHDLETGATWSGRGKPPAWILAKEAAGHIREEFLTQEAAQLIDVESGEMPAAGQADESTAEQPCHP